MTFLLLSTRRVFAGIVLFFAASPLFAADDLSTVPANLGGGLRQLAARRAPAFQQQAAQATPQPLNRHLQMDDAGRVVADVYLNGKAPEANVRAALIDLGAAILASEPPGRSLPARQGVVSVQLPVDQAAAAGRLPGVRSVTLVHRPWHHVGQVTSQGVAAMKANLVVRRHITGTGISVGVMSDSFDLVKPHAATDVRHDDLPGVGNPAHRTTPVFVLREGDPSDPSNIDEGRAMLQIVHDVAPNAALAFATVGATQAEFADSIRRLRTDPGAHCDVLVDDVIFPEEPFFSAGIVEQAVEDVVNSTVLPGKQVIYYSSAGNQADLGFEGDFSPVADSAVRGGSLGNFGIRLDQVPTALTAGGFHNFTPGAGTTITRTVTIEQGDVELDFQWNDLFDPADITSNYNLLVFDANGNFLGDVSGIDDNFETGQASEIVDLLSNTNGAERTYTIAISKTSGGAGTAQHFRCISNAFGLPGGTFLQERVPSIVGHAGARDADAIGAYQYNHLSEPEIFSSLGPVTIYFDDNGLRLLTPEVRQQPTLSGPDGVSTTVIRRFFGTSASAPHVAAVAALVLEAQGGPGSMSASAVRQALQSTTQSHDLDPFTASALLTSTSGTVSLVGRGDDNTISSEDTAFFTLQFTGPAGATLKSVAIDLSPAGLRFDPTASKGFPFTIASATGGATTDVTTPVGAGVRHTTQSRLLLKFADFPAGGKLQFGIDRDFASTHSDGNSADFLARGIVTAVIVDPAVTKPVTVKNFILNQTGAGYSPADGFGLVNADAALRALGH